MRELIATRPTLPGSPLALRAGVVLLLILLGLVMSPDGAAADAAGPTNYRSTVTAVTDAEGQPADLEVEVMGGDAFLVVTVPEGQEVLIPGYEGEPYVRVLSDGTIEVNQRSPARWLNDARYGSLDVEVPDRANADAPPDWEVAARSGTYAWHDHRIHFMSPGLPSEVDATRDEVQRVWEWEIPLQLDGDDVLITGELAWLPGPGVAVPAVAFVLLLAGAVLWGRRSAAAVDALLAVAGVCGLAIGLAANVGLPAGAEGVPALLMLPLLALAALALARWRRARQDPRALWLVALSAVPLLVVGALMGGALTRPVVPGALPAATIRMLVVGGVALALAALIAVAGRVAARTSLEAPDG